MAKDFELAMAKEEKYKEIGGKFAFDVWYAEAWSRKQGYLSYKLACNLRDKFQRENKTLTSVLDVCSGSGEFLNVMTNFAKECYGVDNAEGYLEYTGKKFKKLKLQKVEKLYNFDIKKTFDLVTCNHDVINMFLDFEQWETFFDVVKNHLNDGGMFVFDFYTADKMNNWNDIAFEEDFTLDYVQDVRRQEDGVCVMKEVYYIRESETLYRKTTDTMLEIGFETDRILKALEKAGFKDIELVDVNLEPIEDINAVDRIHIVCKK